jgi:CRP/FNR family transcriptional regulator, cyclic AMP receptor protein
MLPTRIEVLQRMPIFGALRDDALQTLLEHARTREVAAGAFYFHEGDAARSMFVLEAGRGLVTKAWCGREFVLNALGPGDCFGEMSLMDLGPRSASVLAEQDCRAIEFSTDDLMNLYERDVEQFALVQMNISREVCRRLRATDELLFRAQMGELPAGPEAFFRAA